MAKIEAQFLEHQTEAMMDFYQTVVDLLGIRKPKPPKFVNETGRWYVYLEDADHKKRAKVQQNVST